MDTFLRALFWWYWRAPIWTSPKGYRWEINMGIKYASNGRNLRHSGEVKLPGPNDRSNGEQLKTVRFIT